MRAAAGAARAVSRPDGADERAADQVAAETNSHAGDQGSSSALSPSGSVDGSVHVIRTPPVVDHVLGSPGDPLDLATRSRMEPRLGHDLGQVRIHSGPQAGLAAASVRALAFTAGSHIVLGPDAPPAHSARGARLLAHELTHAIQGRSVGGQAVLQRAMAVPESGLSEEKKARIQARLGEFAAEAPVSTPTTMPVAASTAPSAETDVRRTDPALDFARTIASYLVVTEDLDNVDVDALLTEIAQANPQLMSAIASGGKLFSALAELGISATLAVGEYVLLTVRDTLAGDFVDNPTALAIILRTLLTLIPGVDTLADVEDVVANLAYGALYPGEKLTSPAWWLAVVLALVGLFPEFGSAIKGTVQLTVKGVGAAAGAGLDVIAPHLLRLLGSGWVDLAKAGIAEVLAKAAALGPWVIGTFAQLVDLAIQYLGKAALTVGGSFLTAILDAFKRMKALATEQVPKALGDILARLKGTSGEITQKFDKSQKGLDTIEEEATKALKDTATKVAPHTRVAIDAAIPELRDALVSSGLRADFLDGVREMTDKVTEAFANPENFAAALRTVVEQRRKLTGVDVDTELQELVSLKNRLSAGAIPGVSDVSTQLSPEAAAYVAAVRSLSDRGVVELHRAGDNAVLLVRRNAAGKVTQTKPLLDCPEGFVPDDVFMKEVVSGGEAILDFAALGLTDTGAHGAITHFLHDLVADKALGAGGAAAYRAAMDRVQRAWRGVKPGIKNVDPEFPDALGRAQSFEAGSLLWVGTYDRVRSLAQPEALWEPLKVILELVDKEL